MADHSTNLSDRSLSRGARGVEFWIGIFRFGDISLKKTKYKVLKLLVMEKKYVLAVLPAGYYYWAIKAS